jgi:O-antigen ligase
MMAKVALQASTQISPKSWLLAFCLSLLPAFLATPSVFWLLCNSLAVLGIFMLVGLLRHRNSFNTADKALQVLPRCLLFIWCPILFAMIDNPITISQQIWGYPLYALMALAALVILRSANTVKPLAILLSWLSGVVLFNGVSQLALGMDMLNRPFNTQQVTSFFTTYNDYSFYMGMMAMIPLYTLYLVGANRLSHLLMTIFVVGSLLITTKFSAWLMSFWGILPYLYLVYIKPSKRPIVPMVVVPLWLITIFFVVQLFSTQAQHTMALGDYPHYIIDMWRLSSELLTAHWFNGLGVGNFEAAFRPFLAPNAQAPLGIDISHPNNVLLEVFVSTGVIGFLGLLLTWAAMWRLWQQALPMQKKLALPVLMPVVAMWWPINVSHSFYSPQLAAISFFFLALSIAALTQHSEQQ